MSFGCCCCIFDDSRIQTIRTSTNKIQTIRKLSSRIVARTMNEQYSPSTGDELSNKQWVVRTVIMMCSASLSVIGSSALLLKILHERAQTGSITPYDRIILGLSCCDIIASLTMILSKFFVPSETGDLWAFGNPTTCAAYGFLTQLSISSYWYNCLLSYYFTLTVLSQARRQNLVKKCELWLHLSVIFFPITAIMGLYLGYYDDETCYYKNRTIVWIAGIPIIFTILSLITNNIVIYVVVRKSLQYSEHSAGLTLAEKRLKREAMTLMYLYVTCFLVTISPSLIEELLVTFSDHTIVGHTINDSRFFPLAILEAILLPLQGFFNFFIYIKPMYTRFRAANPNKSVSFVVHQALFDPNVPQSTISDSQPTSTTGAIISDNNLEEDTSNPNHALFNSNFLQPHSSSIHSSSSSDLSFGISEGEESILDFIPK